VDEGRLTARKTGTMGGVNYFAHGRRFLREPCILAGTAVPDWLNVVDRRTRVRARAARPFVEDPDPLTAELARGIVQHHHDDDWFHRTRAFAELSWDLTVKIRDALAGDAGLRPSFLGHILVEMLLDAALIQRAPADLAAYYEALAKVDAAGVAAAVHRIGGRPVERLAVFIPRFTAERFLYDYAEDAKLLYRLNQVMRRVKLPPLEEDFGRLLAPAREQVAARADELLRPA
jgi:hypothetical protein